MKSPTKADIKRMKMASSIMLEDESKEFNTKDLVKLFFPGGEMITVYKDSPPIIIYSYENPEGSPFAIYEDFIDIAKKAKRQDFIDYCEKVNPQKK